MRFVQIEMLPAGKALVDIDKLTHAVKRKINSEKLSPPAHLPKPASGWGERERERERDQAG